VTTRRPPRGPGRVPATVTRLEATDATTSAMRAEGGGVGATGSHSVVRIDLTRLTWRRQWKLP
jgi:hypothetical protein